MFRRRLGRVFIGSSSEAERAASILQALLAPHCEPELWFQGQFGLSESTLDELLRIAKEFDFGVFLLTPDDLTVSRDVQAPTARDNVLFELGIFYGALGKRRTFMVFSSDQPPKLPSDLSGITAAVYPNAPTARLRAALGPAALAIREAMEQARPDVLSADCKHELAALLGLDTRRLAEQIGSAAEDVGVNLWFVSDESPRPMLRRELRVRAGSIPPTHWPGWRKGHGVAGWCWDRDALVALDLHAAQLKHATEAEFARLPEDQSLNMSFAELQRTRNEHRAIWGLPLHDRDFEILGVLSVDVAPGCATPFEELDAAVRPVLRDMAFRCRVLLGEA